MRAITKTLMIIFVIIEVYLGLKRTVTVENRDENKTYLPSKEDQIFGMLDFVLAILMIQNIMIL